MPKSYLGRTDLPRGLRNNNPGNLVRTNISWQGKVPHAQNPDTQFEQFTQLRYGLRAMMIDIAGDIAEGTNTLTALINEYAPSHENNTQSYINFVSQATGLLPNVSIPMNKTIFWAIVKAKVMMENGMQLAPQYVTDADYEEAWQLARNHTAVAGIPETLSASVKKKGLTALLILLLVILAIYIYVNYAK